ncbi:MAG: hypothetical protein Q9227_002411 [Pyrenula ochraceoflavens]
MPINLLWGNKRSTVRLEPLTPSSFSLFGSVITSPVPAAITSSPKNQLPIEPYNSQYPNPVSANQSSALKYSPVGMTVNNYPIAPSRHPGQPVQSLFACFPRTLREERFFDVTILERHPYTTQTFSPLGLSKDDSEAFYVVIVAPSLAWKSEGKTKSGESILVKQGPDLANLRAFVARGNQAVVYAPGTWHAPMVVVGERRIDFLVTQFVSGVASEDCEEVTFGDGICVEIPNPPGQPTVRKRKDVKL